MKFVFAILFLVSFVSISQQDEILSLGDLLQYKKSVEVFDEFFPSDFLANADENVPDDKFCFPMCLNSNNAWQLPYVAEVCELMYPEALVLSDDDAYAIARKIASEDMIRNYIGGDGRENQQAVVDIIKEQFESMHLQNDGLYWTASFLQIARTAFEQTDDDYVELVVTELGLFKEELAKTLYMTNEEFKELRLHFLQAVFLGGTDATFETFVIPEIDELNEATLNFGDCDGLDQNIAIIEAALGFVQTKISEGESNAVLWQLCNTLLEAERDRCAMAVVEEESGPEVDMDSEMGTYDGMQDNYVASSDMSSAQQRLAQLLAG